MWVFLQLDIKIQTVSPSFNCSARFLPDSHLSQHFLYFYHSCAEHDARCIRSSGFRLFPALENQVYKVSHRSV